VIANTPLFATGGRDATNIFTERGMGDVLVTFESEANFIANEIGEGAYQVVVPSFGIDARAFVATADVYAREKGNLEVAEAYWEFVFSRAGQEIAARSYNRPSDPQVAAEFADRLPALSLFAVEDVFGSWQEANERHFSPGGTFETIVESLGRN
jgi:sulfate/thiosulfate-binding protein